MEDTSKNRENKPGTVLSSHLCIGLLAHVDAGKTTLAENILYDTGAIRKAGRVDHRDTFLDHNALERARGITIFSKQAELSLGDKQVSLLDTPGHEDFSAEMERTLQILDYAVLIISGADGIRGHDETLWKLLERYHIPTFLFINKMDQPGTDKEALKTQIGARFGSHCLDFSGNTDSSAFMEEAALCDEQLLEKYLETGEISREDIAGLIRERKLFPCYFGSALRHEGIKTFLEGLDIYTLCREYPESFGARVYKIARDDKGVRLTHLKITGGSLKVKMPLDTGQETPEKADQVRVYSGASFKMESQVAAGCICAVTGPVGTWAGQGLGIEQDGQKPVMEPVLNYRIALPEGCNVLEMLGRLNELAEEIPELHIVWEEASREIHAQVMGEVQIEILKSIIAQRYGIQVSFDSGSIVYKETIKAPTEGVGHFEPLRHYAEVHLLLEPLPQGSGLVFDTACPEDDLEGSWQRLILTHLKEREHPGVLTGSSITDMKITLMSGRAHLKHTEGGDFRQATYRAVRQGLKQGESVLLEPVYAFRLEVPSQNVGRALADIQKMNGSFEPPQTLGEMTSISGRAPVALMRGYGAQVSVYTKGMGRLLCTVDGYEPCHNASEVIREIGYDSEADTENPTGSVFCAHGAGFFVPWDQVPQYMHLPSCMKAHKEPETKTQPFPKEPVSDGWVDDQELEEIFARTYGPIKRERNRFNYSRTRNYDNLRETGKKAGAKDEKTPVKEYLLVDGYNIIFAWDELRALSQENMESARTKLADILCDYQGFCQNTLILVFDAYRVEGHPGEIFQYRNIYIVYTKEAETADQYIEKTVHEIGRKHHVTVATSDGTEQVIILGQGARRLSAAGLLEEINQARRQMREEYLKKYSKGGQYLMENMPEELARLMEDVRLGYRALEDAQERGQKS